MQNFPRFSGGRFQHCQRYLRKKREMFKETMWHCLARFLCLHLKQIRMLLHDWKIVLCISQVQWKVLTYYQFSKMLVKTYHCDKFVQSLSFRFQSWSIYNNYNVLRGLIIGNRDIFFSTKIHKSVESGHSNHFLYKNQQTMDNFQHFNFICKGFVVILY